MIINLVRLQSVFIFLIFLILAQTGIAQTNSSKNKSPFPVKYTSLADQNILLKTITLAPVYDNMNGIYAAPVQKLLVELLQNDKAWGFAEIEGLDKNYFIENFDSNPNDVLEVLAKTRAQGLLTAFITKGPRGISARLKLFTHDQGLLLNEEIIEDLNAFEVSKVRESFVTMYHNLKNKLPYRGYVLSRRGLDVTISLGSVNGVKPGQELTLAQIIKLNRHPKLKTLVGVEKEIIAKVEVTKVDNYLSFAKIIFEKETGVVDVGAKVLPAEFLSYPQPKLGPDGAVIGDIQPEEKQKPFTDVIVKENKVAEQKAEVLDRQNSTGVIRAQGVIMQYNETNNLSNGTSPSSHQGFAPGALLGLQYNLRDSWFFDFNLQLSSFSADNGRASSTPASLAYTFTRYNAAIGYNYKYDEDPDGISFSGTLGLDSYKASVSDSVPTSITSTDTNSFSLHVQALMPLTPDYPYSLGARFNLALNPSQSESPVNSGSAKPTITSLGFFGLYPLNPKLRIRVDLDLTNISTKYSGAATRAPAAGSSSIEMMSEMFGIEYLF